MVCGLCGQLELEMVWGISVWLLGIVVAVVRTSSSGLWSPWSARNGSGVGV